MNEGIDIAFMGAKIATRENMPASITVHSLSMAYNIAQMTRYRVEYINSQRLLINGATQVSLSQQEQYRREMIKHSILATLDIASLFFIGVSGLHGNR